MPRKSPSPAPQEIGDVLRARRTDVLQKGLREMAKLLGITPPHLTDIEKGRRRPSDDLLLRISRQYDIPEADLRSGWNRAATIVEQIATQDPLAAEKVPELLRKARGLSSSSQWDDLIKYAAQISKRKPK